MGPAEAPLPRLAFAKSLYESQPVFIKLSGITFFLNFNNKCLLPSSSKRYTSVLEFTIGYLISDSSNHCPSLDLISSSEYIFSTIRVFGLGICFIILNKKKNLMNYETNEL